MPKRFAISKRNQMMVQKSQVVICCVNQNFGGAFTALKYAHTKKKTILNCGEYSIG